MAGEKITFTVDSGEAVDFYVLEEARMAGRDYLLVTDAQADEDGDCYLLKDVSDPWEQEAAYEFVEDGAEMDALFALFSALMEDADVELKK